MLDTGTKYELRQNFFKGASSSTFDVAYSFEYNGFIEQDNAPEASRAWPLTDRRVLTNATGITFHTPVETVRFWLPFSSTATGNLYTGCGGFSFENTGCNKQSASARRMGNAGIIGATNDSLDPAASFAPHMNTDLASFDIVFIHQNSNIYGLTGAQMTLLYWVRQLPPASCKDILANGDSEGDGIYEVDPDGAGSGSPMNVYCDMTTDGGGWTLAANIKGNSIFHNNQTAAVGDVTQLVEDAKMSDAVINLITPTGGFWRFDCGLSSSFVRTASGNWTSSRINAETWTLDRGKDGTFECSANRSGYTFSDLACGEPGHVNWVAAGGLAEGVGCFRDPEGWARPGRLWAR